MVTIYSEYFCFQHQELITDVQDHLNTHPDHCIMEIVTTESGVLYGPGHAEDLVAPELGTSTVVIDGFPTIEAAINYLVTSGVPAGMPTQAISGYNTIESAVQDLVEEVGGAKTINFTFGDKDHNGIKVSSSHYSAMRSFIFAGSDKLGSPSSVKVIADVRGDYGSIRLYDATNGNVICEKQDISNTDLEIIDLGTIENVPTGEAIFELHLKGNGSKKVTCYNLNINF